MNPASQYILKQPQPYKDILLQLQALIEGNFSNLNLKYKWHLPMYYVNDKPFCYLNASKKKGYVDVAFWASIHLEKYQEYLVTENRKVVKSLRYKTIEDINVEVLLAVLNEAYNVNDKGFYKKK